MFLILLGIYGFVVALRRRRLQKSTMTNPKKSATELPNAAVDTNEKDSNGEGDILDGMREYTNTEGITVVPTEIAQENDVADEMEHRQQALEEGELPSIDTQKATSCSAAEQTPSISGTSTNPKERNCRINFIRREQLISFLVGTLHGVAGPGGVLGILPAAQMQNLSLAYAYLASFCISSIFTMGIFAAIFGCLTHKLSQITQLEFQIECFSSAVCALIGTIWLSLSFAGKLDDVFK